MKNLTFIVGFRNLERERVKLSLDSLKVQSCQDFDLVFVDYGSDLYTRSQIQETLGDYAFCHYFYSDTRGWLWNRSKALNAGAKLASSKYIFFTDVDIIFDVNFVEEVLSQMCDDTFLVSDTYRLPKGFNTWSKVQSEIDLGSIYSMKGKGISCYPKDVFLEIGGFNEKYTLWGSEDVDLANRMTRYGLKESFVQRANSYHQWHSKTSLQMPLSILLHNSKEYFEQQMNQSIYSNVGSSWGKIIQTFDRPIYRYVDPNSKVLMNNETIRIISAAEISGVHKWVNQIWTSDGTLFAIPKRKLEGSAFTAVNKLLRHLGIQVVNDISRLGEFALSLNISTPGLFTDYFLDCQFNKKDYLLILK